MQTGSAGNYVRMAVMMVMMRRMTARLHEFTHEFKTEVAQPRWTVSQMQNQARVSSQPKHQRKGDKPIQVLGLNKKDKES